MTEVAGAQHKTTIIDTRNGDVWTYQPDAGKGVPAELFSKAGTPTAAQLAAYPTAVSSLRTFLIRQAKQQQAQAERAHAGPGQEAAQAPGPSQADYDGRASPRRPATTGRSRRPP